jgi:hypothetical protein
MYLLPRFRHRNGLAWQTPRRGPVDTVAQVEYDWSKTIGITVTRGRDFDPAFTSDASACLINEAAVAKWGYKIRLEASSVVTPLSVYFKISFITIPQGQSPHGNLSKSWRNESSLHSYSK